MKSAKCMAAHIGCLIPVKTKGLLDSICIQAKKANINSSIGSVVDAVAAGAVVRTLNKESGPNRVAKTAYGLGVFEPYDKEVHGNQATLDGLCDPREKYVKCIQWVSKIVS